MLRYICCSAVALFIVAGCGSVERSGMADSVSVGDVITTQEALDARESVATENSVDTTKISREQEQLFADDAAVQQSKVSETAGMEYRDMEGMTE